MSSQANLKKLCVVPSATRRSTPRQLVHRTASAGRASRRRCTSQPRASGPPWQPAAQPPFHNLNLPPNHTTTAPTKFSWPHFSPFSSFSTFFWFSLVESHWPFRTVSARQCFTGSQFRPAALHATTSANHVMFFSFLPSLPYLNSNFPLTNLSLFYVSYYLPCPPSP